VADLRTTEPSPQDRTVTTYQGVIVASGAGVAVNVNGNILPCRWADPVVVAVGDPVLVEINSSRSGQGAAFVRSRLTSTARPGKGTVATVPASSPTIGVTGSDGVAYTATFVSSYTPVVGDTVLLSWNAAVPSVQGKVTTTAPPAVPVSPTAPVGGVGGVNTGTTPFPASASDTLWPQGGWGTWAGGGGRVYQGSYGSGPVYGAWFYGGSTAQLAGKTIRAIRFRLGGRLPVGGSSSPVTLHLYAHTSANKPGGDVNRVAGPWEVTVQPGQGLTDYTLPLDFAAALQGGGGIAIAGDPYCGFYGCNTQPESGLITMDWSA
jgi:hypothetical protein